MFRVFFLSPLPKEKDLFGFFDFLGLARAIFLSPSGREALRSCLGRTDWLACRGEMLLPFAQMLVVASELVGRSFSGLDAGLMRLFLKLRNLLNALVLVSLGATGEETTAMLIFRLRAWEESACLFPWASCVAAFL